MTCQLYLITPPSLPGDFPSQLEAALSAAPVACLQLRLKGVERSTVVQAAQTILPIVRAHDTTFLINDDPTLVGPCGADGVHIGQDDMPLAQARDLLGDAVIGVTCHDSKDLAFAAAKAGADYVAFGAVYPTRTKDAPTRIDLDLLAWWAEAVETPCVAIGGITVDNASEVVATGADFIAVSAGVWSHPEGAAAAVSHLSRICVGAE